MATDTCYQCGAFAASRLCSDCLAQGRISKLEKKHNAMRELTYQLLKTLEEMVQYSTYSIVDHACSKCRPDSELLVKGFVCVYHAAYAALEDDI